MVSKEDRKKYGKSGQPIPATKVLVRDMEHDSEGSTKSWIFINEREGTRIHANSYDGALGRDFTPQEHPFNADDKKLQKKLRDYTEVEVDECPFVVAV